MLLKNTSLIKLVLRCKLSIGSVFLSSYFENSFSASTTNGLNYHYLLYCNIVMKRVTGYSLREPGSLTMPRFSSTHGKNSVAHRGPVLWNALIFKDKNFSNISCKDLKKKTRSMDIFIELTFKETSTTTTSILDVKI